MTIGCMSDVNGQSIWRHSFFLDISIKKFYNERSRFDILVYFA